VVWQTVRGLFVGRFAADLVAMLAIVTALLLGEPLAGLIVVLMQTGGEALELYAQGRASAAVRELEAAAPRLAHRMVGGTIEDVSAELIAVGDELLLRPGELLASDAVVLEGRSHVDASRLTGEPMPVSAHPGVRLLSGSLNIEGPLSVRATARASESQYARIVDLVRTAQESKSPLQRLADRYAAWFTPLTLVVCALAYMLSGDPSRVLAVLVVATPCPLILATPVAVVGGINRAARHGIIFRHGTALEQLGRVDVAVFDKTGTLTIGRPKVDRVQTTPEFTAEELLRLAGSVEHGSGHLLAHRHPGERREEVLECFDLAFAHAGQKLEADDLACEEKFLGLDQAAEQLDRRRQPAEVVDRDARVEQLHLTPRRDRRSFRSPPRMASTYSAPLRRRPRQEPALARSAPSLSSLPWRPKVDRTARRTSSERDAPVSCEARSRSSSSSSPR